MRSRGHAHKVLGDQRDEVADVRVDDVFDCGERCAADEERHPAEHALLFLRQQVVAPRNCGFERALPLVGISCSAQQVEPLREPLEQHRRRERGCARCGKLDSERKIVEPFAERRDGTSVEVMCAGGVGSSDEQCDRVGTFEGVDLQDVLACES